LLTPLHWAAYKGYTRVVWELIKRGADLSAKTYYGHTPVELAKIGGFDEVVKIIEKLESDRMYLWVLYGKKTNPGTIHIKEKPNTCKSNSIDNLKNKQFEEAR
jgi:ankyrin repeat protein